MSCRKEDRAARHQQPTPGAFNVGEIKHRLAEGKAPFTDDVSVWRPLAFVIAVLALASAGVLVVTSFTAGG